MWGNRSLAFQLPKSLSLPRSHCPSAGGWAVLAAPRPPHSISLPRDNFKCTSADGQPVVTFPLEGRELTPRGVIPGSTMGQPCDPGQVIWLLSASVSSSNGNKDEIVPTVPSGQRPAAMSRLPLLSHLAFLLAAGGPGSEEEEVTSNEKKAGICHWAFTASLGTAGCL